MHRFPSPLPAMEDQPRPGARESRFPIPRDRSKNRPKEASAHV